MTETTTTGSPEETIDFGRSIGGKLSGGEVIAITGSLGSGKTHLVKGIAAGLDAVDSARVNSPTFVIINEYHGRLTLYHIDAYRLESAFQLEMLGFDELCSPESVVAIEWADRVREILENTDLIRINMEFVDRDNRRIRMDMGRC